MPANTPRIVSMVLVPLFLAVIILTAKPVQTVSEQYLTNTLKKTTIAFAGARSINALISVIQDIEAGGSLKLLGTGGSATISPFEWLDPLNDLVERFSWIMLASSVSLGIQLFINEITPWLSLVVLLPAFIMFFVLALMFRRSGRSTGRHLYRVGMKILIMTVLLSILMPAMAGINRIAYNHFLADTYKTAAASLNKNTFEMPIPENEEGARKTVKRFKEKAVQLKNRAKKLIGDLLDLIVVFIIQTMVLPLFVLWLFLKGLSFVLDFKETFPGEPYFLPKSK